MINSIEVVGKVEVIGTSKMDMLDMIVKMVMVVEVIGTSKTRLVDMKGCVKIHPLKNMTATMYPTSPKSIKEQEKCKRGKTTAKESRVPV